MPTWMPMEIGKLNVPAVAATDGREQFSSRRLFVKDPLTNIDFLIDTGADISVIPVSVGEPTEGPPDFTLAAANGSGINIYGSKVLKLDFGLKRNFIHPFYVASVNKPIVGADFIHKFGLLVDIRNRKLIDPKSGLNSIGEILVNDNTPTPTSSAIESCEFAILLKEFPSITKEMNFLESPTKHNIVHHIHTQGHLPVSRARRLDPLRLKAAKDEFAYMQKVGICQPSSSPCSSPLHMAPKKENTWRPCGDYRRLNSITTPDRYSIPFISDCDAEMEGCTILSKLDVVRSFHHVPIAEEDVHKTAIITPFGLFEFPRMCFGLRGASQTYQRFMNLVCHDLDFLYTYIDDILVMSKNKEEHLKHLRILFERLEKYGLHINASKCVFGVPVIDFLGFQISKDGVKPSPSRVSAIVDLKSPTSVKEVQGFLGMVNYYHRFLPSIAHVLTPIHAHITLLINGSKTKKRKKPKVDIPSSENCPSSPISPKPRPLPFSWPDECEQAFQSAKQILSKSVLLAHPRKSAEFCIVTDASDFAIGAVLQQKSEKGWEPLAFFSKKLTDPQRRYSAFDRELLAIYKGIEHFRYFVEGREFHVKTDHKPLTTALFSKTDRNPRQARHLDYISQFTSDIRYVKGVDNVVADTLSRPTIDGVDFVTPGLEDLARSQTEDQELLSLRNSQSDQSSIKLRPITIPASNLVVWCENSSGKDRPFVPQKDRIAVFQSIHGLSHPSIRNTRRKVTEKFFWPKMSSDVNRWARACVPCQKNKVIRHTKSKVEKISMPSARFTHVHMDIVGPLPSSNGFLYLLTIVDRFTRWPEAYPMRDMTAKTIAEIFVREFIPRFGVPKKVTTDQGRQFEGKLMEELFHLLGAKRIRTTAYHPQANGMVERFHRTLKASLRASGNSANWSRELPFTLLGLRTSFNEDLQASPAEMVYGQTLCVPGELSTESPSNVEPSEFARDLSNRMKSIRPTDPRPASCKVHVPRTLEHCEKVFVRVDRVRVGFEEPYEGPFLVIRRLRKSFIVDRSGTHANISIDRLKPAFDDVSANEASWKAQTHRKTRRVKFSLTSLIQEFDTELPVTRMVRDDMNTGKVW